jgi:hypothetical protein
MRRIAVNLKTLVQCPAIWFWHLIGGVLFLVAVVGPLSEPVAGEGKFMAYLLLSYWAATVISSMMKETLIRPFAYCMPGHRAAVRTTLVALGILLNCSVTLIVFAHPGLNGADAALAYLSASMLGIAFYLLTVYLVFAMRNALAVWGIPILVLWLSSKLFSGALANLEAIVLSRPAEHTAACLVLLVLVWRNLGSRNSARKACGRTFLSMQYMWNRTIIDRYTRSRKIEGLDRQSRKLWRWIESRFLSRMNRLVPFSVRRHALGTRYSILGAVLPSSLAVFLLAVLAFAVFITAFGYIQPENEQASRLMANICYYIPVLLGMTLPIPLYAPLLLPAGRRETFRTCLFLGIIGGVLALATSAALYGLSSAVDSLFPEIILAGKSLRHHPVEQELILFPLVPLPLLFTCQFVFPRRAQFPQTLIMIVALVLLMIVPWAFADLHPAGKAVLLLLAWWSFVGPLHHYCYHRDLALP